jgi:hypothetical protein
MPNKDRRHELPDVPALTAVCTVTTIIALIVALVVEAPVLVTTALAVVLIALGLYIRRTLN